MNLAWPFAVQGLLMTVDEFYCHRRRVLRRWERLGHPLDTLTFIACFIPLLFFENTIAQPVFIGLALFSCIFITKDEWQHRDLCTGFENWLHALLFMLHPVVLLWAFYVWRNKPQEFQELGAWVLVFSFGFFLYQLFYWNVLRSRGEIGRLQTAIAPASNLHAKAKTSPRLNGSHQPAAPR